MTKEEFIKWIGVSPEKEGLALVTLEGVIDRAIAEHEAKAWKKYPDGKPKENEVYMVYRGNREWISIDKYEDGEFSFMDEDVTAFRELPAPYKERESHE